MKTKLFTLFLALAASIGTMFAESGTCGDNLTWDLTDGVLTISGTGAMTDLAENNYNDAPWYSYRESITSITIGNSVTSIRSYAFGGCTSLTSVTIGNSVTYIGLFAFGGCTGLTNITIPNSVISIWRGAFYDCSGLTSVAIGNSVIGIGDEAFCGCTGLTSITIPNSVTDIGWNAFLGCTSLTSPVYNAHVFAFLPTSYIGAYMIPEGIESIAGSAFHGCSGLTSVTLPNSVTNIGYYAFFNCTGLTSVTIGNSVTSIESYAFSNCTNLSAIYVPCGSLGAYKQSWPDYSSIIKYSPLEYTITGNVNIADAGNITLPQSICDDIIITACPNFGFHFTQWSDGNTENPRSFTLTQDTSFTAEFAHNPTITYNYNSQFGCVTGPTMTETGVSEANITFEAIPNRGCYFVQWKDGNKENPRTIKLSKDTTMEAIFDYLLSGKCGKDNVLTWKFEPSAMALNITGKGALSDNYTYGIFIESLTIGNEVTLIGQSAFSGCNNLKNIIIGSSVKVLEGGAFANCSAIETITCYGQRPPTVNLNALYGLDYSTIVYVPADYLNTYQMHDAWGLYDVRPLGAKSTETTEVTVTPADNTAEVVWPVVSGAATYELVIKDKEGNVICTLVFNANGQLTSIAFAPGRDNAPQQTLSSGFAFTVTGLNGGTDYDLTLTSKDSNGATLNSNTISFTTTGEPQGIEDVINNPSQMTNKVIRNGQIFILRGEKVYTLQGQEVK